MECRFRFVCSVFVGCNYDTGKQDVILCTNFKRKICGRLVCWSSLLCLWEFCVFLAWDVLMFTWRVAFSPDSSYKRECLHGHVLMFSLILPKFLLFLHVLQSLYFQELQCVTWVRLASRLVSLCICLEICFPWTATATR